MASISSNFRSFNGAEIVATFNGQVIGELQSISYNTTRDSGEVYEIGNVQPIEAREGYSGTITVDERQSFTEELRGKIFQGLGISHELMNYNSGYTIHGDNIDKLFKSVTYGTPKTNAQAAKRYLKQGE